MLLSSEYRSSFEFAGSNLEAYYHEEGRLTPKTGGGYLLEYTIKDHLGNARISFADVNGNTTIEPATEILQEQTYYPFGLEQSGLMASISGTENMYQYNGKEFNADLDLNMYDYGARWYMAELGRWGTVDPLAEKYLDMSVYNYVLNNPLVYIDPDGRDARTLYDEATNTITIQTTVYITGAGTSQEVADKMNERQKETFKEGKADDGTTIKFDITYKYDENADINNTESIEDWQDGDNVLEFKTEEGRSFVSGLHPDNGVIFMGNVTSGLEESAAMAQGDVVVHETGHLIGFKDRYEDIVDENGVTSSKPEEGYSSNFMADSQQKGISQSQYNNASSFIKKLVLAFENNVYHEIFEDRPKYSE